MNLLHLLERQSVDLRYTDGESYKSEESQPYALALCSKPPLAPSLRDEGLEQRTSKDGSNQKDYTDELSRLEYVLTAG